MRAAMRQPATSPLSLHRHLSERSSPSRVRCAAQNPRALDRSGPFRKLSSEKGKGANAKSQPFPASRLVLPPVGRRPGGTRIPTIRPPPLDDVNNLQA